MPDKQDVSTQPGSAAQRTDGATEHALIPPADVLEDRGGITLHLDMPGVSKERLKIEADKNTLVIEGDMQIAMPESMEALHAEVQSTRYRRSFTLSGELEAEKAVANLNNGVLSLSIPLRAELRPRRIEVSGA
jgi:HSP20 family protein